MRRREPDERRRMQRGVPDRVGFPVATQCLQAAAAQIEDGQWGCRKRWLQRLDNFERILRAPFRQRQLSAGEPRVSLTHGQAALCDR